MNPRRVSDGGFYFLLIAKILTFSLHSRVNFIVNGNVLVTLPSLVSWFLFCEFLFLLPYIFILYLKYTGTTPNRQWITHKAKTTLLTFSQY